MVLSIYYKYKIPRTYALPIETIQVSNLCYPQIMFYKY